MNILKQSKFLYIIQQNNQYKIGITKDIDKRIKQLSTGSPYEFKLIYSKKTYDPYIVEKKIHKEFKREKTKGEWFKINDVEDLIFFTECTISTIEEKYRHKIKSTPSHNLYKKYL